MKWSQSFLPKVLGGLFLLAAHSSASEYEKAIETAKKAAMIQSGLTKKIDGLKKQATDEIKKTLDKHNVLEEAATAGGILQIIKEKGVKIKYEGVDYFITPTQVKLIIYL